MPSFITIKITETAFPKTFVVPIKNRVIFGRSDEDDPSIHPDVDLIGCNAISNGISRQHAALEVQSHGDCMLFDLGSRNGTALNGITLEPHTPSPMSNGDRVRLGKLEFNVYFED